MQTVYVLKIREPEYGARPKTFRYDTEGDRDDKAAEALKHGFEVVERSILLLDKEPAGV